MAIHGRTPCQGERAILNLTDSDTAQASTSTLASSAEQASDDAISAEIQSGLNAEARHINPKYFYDEYGSQLFDQITQLDEYYPTRTEITILTRFAEDIARATGRGSVILEPGAGSCAKIRLLLEALAPACYVPIDISREFLFAAAQQLQSEFPHIPIHPVAADMQADIQLPDNLDGIPRMVFYPGSTIGNYTPAEAVEFLRHVRRTIGDNGGLLIGVDLQKDPAILNLAYNDAAGVTAAFNRNCLSNINTLTGANFDPERFRHIAFYNESEHRIEMHLESDSRQSVVIGGQSFDFKENERILTEYSYKYTVESFAQLAAEAGLHAREHWVDEDQLFSLQYFTAS